MRLVLADALVPTAAALAVAFPPRRGLATVATLALAKMTADHLTRDEPRAAAPVALPPAVLPQLRGQARDVVTAALNGTLIGVGWLLPTAAARRLPAAVGPAVSGLAMLGVHLASQARAEAAR